MYKRAIGLSALAGLRGVSAPAFLSYYLSHGRNKKLGGTIFSPLGDERVSALLGLAAVGEIIADKLPFVADRTDIGPLVGRAASGALVGAVIFINEGEQPLAGAATGVITALASTLLSFQLRTRSTSKLHIPNVLAGLLEDGIVVAAGSRLISS